MSACGARRRTASTTRKSRASHTARRSELPPGTPAGLEESGRYTAASPQVWTNATHVCTCEVDVATGQVELLRYIVSEDCGPMINPSVVEGQIDGGTVQGIGGALYEHLVYDEDGNPVTTTFLDYLLPTAAEIPVIEHGHVETPGPGPGRLQGRRRGRRHRCTAGGGQRGRRRARTFRSRHHRPAAHAFEDRRAARVGAPRGPPVSSSSEGSRAVRVLDDATVEMLARSWEDGWNRGDLETIMAPFAAGRGVQLTGCLDDDRRPREDDDRGRRRVTRIRRRRAAPDARTPLLLAGHVCRHRQRRPRLHLRSPRRRAEAGRGPDARRQRRQGASSGAATTE